MSRQLFFIFEHFVNNNHSSKNFSVRGELFPVLALSTINGNDWKKLFVLLTYGVVYCVTEVFFRAFKIMLALSRFTWQKQLFYLCVPLLYFIFLHWSLLWFTCVHILRFPLCLNIVILPVLNLFSQIIHTLVDSDSLWRFLK